MTRLKNKDDIEGIRKSCKLLAETFQVLSEYIKEGASGLDVDKVAREYIEKNGGKPSFLGYKGFPNTLCVSINDQVIHGIPHKKPFESGDVVGIDCGIILNGYFSDSAFTFPIGKVDDALKNLLKTAEESLYLGIDQATAGNRVHDISRAIFKHNRKEGYGIVRPYCGHGVGFEIHEDPQVPNYVGAGPNPRLKPGMVIAIEPMVNLGGDDVFVASDGWTVVTTDRKPSAHFEHTVAILEDRTEILTKL